LTTRNPITQSFEWVLESRIGGLMINLILIPILCLSAILLPPVSLLDRALSYDYTSIGRNGGVLTDPDGTKVSFLPEGIKSSFRARLAALPRSTFLEGSAGRALLTAAESIPPNLVMKSPYYQFDYRGDPPQKVILTVPIPNESEPYGTLDLYAWNGDRWEWLPNRKVATDDLIESELDYMPSSAVVMQTHAIHPIVSTDYNTTDALPQELSASLVEINPLGYALESEGKIVGTASELPDEAKNASLNIIPTIRNWGDDGSIRSDLVDNLLVDSEGRTQHVQTIVNLVQSHAYQGIDLDYRGINPDLKREYNAFLKELRASLPEGKQLSVRVELPHQVSADTWETGGYDWQTIGRLADIVKVPTFPDPKAYQPSGQMESMLDWAVGQVSRYKIQLQLTTFSTEQFEGITRHLSYQKALEPLGNAAIIGDVGVIVPGQEIGFTLAGLSVSTGVQFDSTSGNYWYAYLDQNNKQHTVYLENAASIARKLQFVAQYNLRGVAIQGALSQNNDARIWEVIRKFLELVIPPVESQYSVVWRVHNADGGVIDEQIVDLSAPNYKWQAPAAGGSFNVEAAIASSRNSAVAVPRGTVPILVATLTPIPTATPLPTNTPVPVPTATPTTEPTPTPEKKPSKIAEVPTNTEGKTEPPAPKPVKPSSAPPPGPSRGNIPFGYGIQTDPRGSTAANVGHLKTLGFNWVKFQMPWKDVENARGNFNWDMWDQLIGAYNGNGIQVMLSIPKAPEWARPAGDDRGVEGPPADPVTYATFVGQVANRYRGKVQAIEVWNEQNLWYEAGGKGRINAASYVQLLQAAYTGIKQANSDMIVISGALTPAGNVGDLAMDDIQYLTQMYANGAKGYFDVLGAHPSGFNCPATANWQTVTAQEAGADPGFGTFSNRHHSWCFLGTMEGYRNVMIANGDGAKSISPTEFGWAVTGNPQPGYEYARDNTPEEQAKWIVDAYQWGKGAGWVGPMFLWNLDYGVTAANTELANFGIIGKPAYNALAGMAK